LVLERGVAVAPGETFGPKASGLVRLSLAASTETLDEGLARLAGAVEQWPAAEVARAVL
jgi:aspartate aminotransferase